MFLSMIHVLAGWIDDRAVSSISISVLSPAALFPCISRLRLSLPEIPSTCEHTQHIIIRIAQHPFAASLCCVATAQQKAAGAAARHLEVIMRFSKAGKFDQSSESNVACYLIGFGSIELEKSRMDSEE